MEDLDKLSIIHISGTKGKVKLYTLTLCMLSWHAQSMKTNNRYNRYQSI